MAEPPSKTDSPTSSDSAEREALTLSIMVVSYNTREMTVECLRSLQNEAADVDYELLFLDNDSNDGSFEAVQAEFGSEPKFSLKHSKENLGFAKANNVLAKEARGEFLLLLNPDTVVLENAIQNLVSFAKRTREHLIWGGRTIIADGTLDGRSCHGMLSLRGLIFRVTGISKLFSSSEFFNVGPIGNWQRDTEREVGWITGCLMLIDRALWNQLEGFAPAFFMYGEEAEMQIRARELGARPILTPDSTIIHHGGASEKVRWQTMAKVHRGEITIINYHWSRPAAWIGKKLFYFNALFRVSAFNLAAKLTRKEHYKQAAAEWSQMWKARSDWLKGY
ncbi:MAG: glycosyl transferase family 2 [Planctomycetaceae bacterium]|nr:glycosyl transferase family 2 [Planctomycetaceae bacterium]